ncbi:aldo-keto reductase family 1 member B1-like [Oppia nitens]|uniref:aldo-keto reductase family 1 member B1-like n=1 Tax=Oppia nitens TaxID=1686743 RepID=UPI0023DC9753|nr:aldo-keto reductase family 1 member B1-like [Oppia nitens]
MSGIATKVPFLTLNDGNRMPIIGLGTYEAPPGVVENVVRVAIDAGYRHFDCADFYENEHEVGQAIRDAIRDGKVKRDELFITTKVWPNWHGKGRPTLSAKRSLKNLGLPYVDLLLIHWPTPLKQVDDNFYPTDATGQALFDNTIELIDVWKEFEQIKKDGLTRSIGVSNFNSQQIEDLIKNSSTVPVVNQVECHPYLSQEKLLNWCESRGIKLTAYSPLARSGTVEEKNTTSPLDIPVIKQLASKYGVSAAAICIKWQTQRGVSVIPKSATKERIIANIDLFNFNLTDSEVKAINDLNRDWRNNTWTQFGINKHRNWPFAIPF